MMHAVPIFTLIIIVQCHRVVEGSGEKFTAIIELKKVLHAERDIANEIDDYIKAEEDRLSKLRRISADYKKHSHDALLDTERYLGNPVNAYLLVKRFTIDWNNIVQSFISNSTIQELVNKINTRQDDFPDGDDLSGVITALLRLQDTYQIPASKIAKGEIAGVDGDKTPELSAADSFSLGRYAYTEDDFYHTFIWMRQALDQVNAGDSSKDWSTIVDHLAFAAMQQGNIKYALDLTNQLLEIDQSQERLFNNKKHYEELLEAKAMNGEPISDSIRNEQPSNQYQQGSEFIVYEKLCRGEDTHPQPPARVLVCSYEDFGRPWLKYGPIKQEVVYDKPRIIIFHEIMTNSEMDRIKELAGPRLNRATIQNSLTGKLEFANYRISKSAWLKDELDPVCNKINRRIRQITGLSVDTAEDLQVVNYGIGGHYEPHFDFARKEEKNAFKSLGTGNRIATLIYYMSDVQAGGATVFPYIGLKLWPVKGAAAFWFNLHASGEGDYLTRHAACPVLAGSKWVCNKWFHERGQEFLRPCKLRPDHPEPNEEYLVATKGRFVNSE
ncbi:prolyl 4-hydroxylase subunit alpha-1-like isoform X4 [Tubulanus polymorphus]|uniref:prolyl 4-hydroxylase subunit alpha-1-like isoform X4 n=1 Tax=Tubulanus polymorphus TaxID=672921 RepID=UPI003DA485EF